MLHMSEKKTGYTFIFIVKIFLRLQTAEKDDDWINVLMVQQRMEWFCIDISCFPINRSKKRNEKEK